MNFFGKIFMDCTFLLHDISMHEKMGFWSHGAELNLCLKEFVLNMLISLFFADFWGKEQRMSLFVFFLVF